MSFEFLVDSIPTREWVGGILGFFFPSPVDALRHWRARREIERERERERKGEKLLVHVEIQMTLARRVEWGEVYVFS